jgi:hypothetical protein
MTNRSVKNISRRDALKLLGAATGAAVLANLPAKWKTPQLASGVLPAHAQTSNCLTITIEYVSVPEEVTWGFSSPTIPPTTTVGNIGEQGAIWAWECQPGCIYFETALFSANQEPQTAIVRVTIGDTTFDWVFETGTNSYIHGILVDGETGVYSEYNTDTQDYEPHPTCEWPIS